MGGLKEFEILWITGLRRRFDPMIGTGHAGRASDFIAPYDSAKTPVTEAAIVSSVPAAAHYPADCHSRGITGVRLSNVWV